MKINTFGKLNMYGQLDTYGTGSLYGREPKYGKLNTYGGSEYALTPYYQLMSNSDYTYNGIANDNPIHYYANYGTFPPRDIYVQTPTVYHNAPYGSYKPMRL